MILQQIQIDQFLDAIRMGLDTESSASYANIPVSLMYNYLSRGKIESERCFKNGKVLKIKPSEGRYVGIYNEFLKAKSELQIELLGSIKSSDNFKAQQWLLERTNAGYQSTDGLTYFEEDSNGFI